MAWSQKVAGRRYAIDGQLASAIAAAKASAVTPAAQQAVEATAAAALALVRDAPPDCDIYVRLAGHRGAEGNGNAVLVFAMRTHQNPGEGFDPEATVTL